MFLSCGYGGKISSRRQRRLTTLVPVSIKVAAPGHLIWISTSSSLAPVSASIVRTTWPTSGAKVFVFQLVRTYWRKVVRLQAMIERAVGNAGRFIQTDHSAHVLSHAKGKFLAVKVVHFKMRLHYNARLSAVNARFPGTFQTHQITVLKLFGDFAEIPNVAGFILSIPINRILHQLAVNGRRVMHHYAGNTENDFGLTSNIDLDDVPSRFR